MIEMGPMLKKWLEWSRGPARDSVKGEADARRFLCRVACVFSVGLVCAVVLISGTLLMGREPLVYQQLVEYQQAKVVAGVPQTIFVGDSSLGNAIDVREWQRVRGEASANLALTGAFGYAGTLAMVENVLERQRVRNVVIFQTSDMMRRPPAPWSFEAVRLHRDRIRRWANLWVQFINLDQLHESVSYVATTFSGSGAEALQSGRARLEGDYIRQARALPADTAAQAFAVTSIKPAKMAYLEKIAALCRKRQLNCVYVHGPIAEPVCRASEAYFLKVSGMIEKLGLSLASTRPLCIPPAEYGDTLDHVAPAARRKYTRAYAHLLSPFLKSAPVAGSPPS